MSIVFCYAICHGRRTAIKTTKSIIQLQKMKKVLRTYKYKEFLYINS